MFKLFCDHEYMVIRRGKKHIRKCVKCGKKFRLMV